MSNRLIQTGFVIVLAAGVWASTVRADDAWGTDFDAAKQAAAERKVPILVNFTGSDWCPWCVRLDREVFSQDAFKDFAKTNLVLFVADFPQDKPQSDTVVAQNQKLEAQYRVEGFPTILLLDASGGELARTGYRPGGADAYVDHLRSLIAGKQ